jgi:hypothetical protein
MDGAVDKSKGKSQKAKGKSSALYFFQKKRRSLPNPIFAFCPMPFAF